MAISEDTSARPASATRQELLSLLASHKDRAGFYPLAGLDGGHAIDRCEPILAQASCLLSFMSAAYEDSAALVKKDETSEVDLRVGKVIAGALDGVQTLVSLASFLLEEEGN